MLSSYLLTLQTKLSLFRRNTLLMNSVYLMMASGGVAALGFLFWVMVARSYSAPTVGLATTLLSLSGLISLLSLAGFDTTFVRFLPGTGRKNDHINSGLIIVGAISLVLSLGLGLLLPLISPSIAFIGHSPVYLLSFVFFTAVTSLNTLTNAIFLAYKRAGYIFVINLSFSCLKAALPFLITHGSSMTIFNLAGATQLFGLGLSLGIMRFKLNYSFRPYVHLDILKVIKRYSLSVYVSSLLNLLPPTLLPLLVLHQLGADQAAYYYIAFTVASVLYTIAYASTQSVFAEGSHDQAAIRQHLVQAAKLIAILLLPAVVILGVASKFMLGIFGHNYATGAVTLLRLFTLGAVFVACYSALGAIFKVTKNLHGVVVMNLVYVSTILGFSCILLPHLGLSAIGWAWLIGNLFAVITGLIFVWPRRLTPN